MSQTTSEPTSALYIARQPILDDHGGVFGYELLYRAAPGDVSCSLESNLASARVLTGAVFDVGLDTLTGGRPAFLNVTASLVIDQIDALVPPGNVVLELLETIDVSPELITACRRLRARGYQLALDDFVPATSSGSGIRRRPAARPDRSAASISRSSAMSSPWDRSAVAMRSTSEGSGAGVRSALTASMIDASAGLARKLPRTACARARSVAASTTSASTSKASRSARSLSYPAASPAASLRPSTAARPCSRSPRPRRPAWSR